jgi:YcaO-like protein with predicted kinase domain
VSDGGKAFRDGARRSCAPAETWARLAPLLPVFGITRVANITGLDRLGIPVVTACRPNARSLSVFQGKGLSLEAARVSAVMEAYETWCAESIDRPLRFASLDEMRFSHPLIDVDALPLASLEPLDPGHPYLWIEGRDLFGGGDFWLPHELVHANYALPEPPHSATFAATTNGLASGNTRDEALLHALMEVIERDAVTLWKLGPDAWRGTTAVWLGTVGDPACRWLLDRFAAADIDVAVFDVTSDLGIPAFLALIDDASGMTGAPELGCGAHPAPEVALARALTEAAQARATFIAGAREDIPDEDYGAAALASRRGAARAILDGLTPMRSFADRPGVEGPSFEDDIEATLAALARAGMRQAIAVDVGKPAFGLAVVRVVVPGLEAALEGPRSAYVPGRRAAALLAEAAA